MSQSRFILAIARTADNIVDDIIQNYNDIEVLHVINNFPDGHSILRHINNPSDELLLGVAEAGFGKKSSDVCYEYLHKHASTDFILGILSQYPHAIFLLPADLRPKEVLDALIERNLGYVAEHDGLDESVYLKYIESSRGKDADTFTSAVLQWLSNYPRPAKEVIEVRHDLLSKIEHNGLYCFTFYMTDKIDADSYKKDCAVIKGFIGQQLESWNALDIDFDKSDVCKLVEKRDGLRAKQWTHFEFGAQTSVLTQIGIGFDVLGKDGFVEFLTELFDGQFPIRQDIFEWFCNQYESHEEVRSYFHEEIYGRGKANDLFSALDKRAAPISTITERLYN